jgi:hypothetical protein
MRRIAVLGFGFGMIFSAINATESDYLIAKTACWLFIIVDDCSSFVRLLFVPSPCHPLGGILSVIYLF